MKEAGNSSGQLLRKDRGPGVRFPPPVTFCISAVLGYGAHLLIPLPLTGGWRAGWSAWLPAAVLLISGGIVLLIALISFIRHKTAVEPWKPASTLITSGLYKYSRNPIYVAFFVTQCGFAFLLGSLWLVLTGLAALWLIYLTVVKKEEAYLFNLFGADYVYYKKRVRRWL